MFYTYIKKLFLLVASTCSAISKIKIPAARCGDFS